MENVISNLIAARASLPYSPARSQICHAITAMRRAARAKTQAGRDRMIARAIESVRLARLYA